MFVYTNRFFSDDFRILSHLEATEVDLRMTADVENRGS